MVQVSFTLPLPARQAGRGGRAAARRQDGPGAGAARPRQGDGPGLHLLRRLRLGDPPRRPARGRGRRARVPAADLQGDQRRDQEAAAPQARRGRRLHRHGRPHRRHRRHPQHQGVRRGEGPGVLPRDDGGEPRRPGARARPRQHGARGARRCRARLAGRHPEGRPHPQHHGDVGRLPRGVPRRTGAAARRRRPALRGGVGRCARGRPRLRPRHDPRRGRVLPRPRARHVRAPTPTREDPSDDRAPRSALTVTHRRYVPYSHAHYAGNLVDGAYSLAAFGDVATELCIRTDGDEGLFASYSDVQFLAPVRAGDVIEISRDARAGRDAVAGDGVRGARRRRGALRSEAPPPPTSSTRPSWRRPPEGSSWCRLPA